jgi:anti-sigma regulatory factor (Ser/Thr protein kinase)
VRGAREFVGDLLDPLGIESTLARIVTSELATNAVRHAQTPFRVAVAVHPGTIRIEVEDGAGAQKIATEMATDRTGGGLLIVETAAASWGVEHRGEKKAVWVELPAISKAEG